MTTPVRAGLYALLMAIVLGALACGGGPDPGAEAGAQSAAAIPTRATLEAMVFGGGQPCTDNADCASGTCWIGGCAGILTSDQRATQEAIAETLSKAAAQAPEALGRLVDQLVLQIRDSDEDLARRARAVLALEAIGAREALATLGPPKADADGRLGEALALARVRLGDPAPLAQVIALTEHDHDAVAIEAIHALGASQQPDALMPLLRLLNPELDRILIGAALDAMERLADRRALSPLVAFLERAPEYLRHRIVTALRMLSGARLGLAPTAWRAWLTAAQADGTVPPAPAFTMREFNHGADLGLPTP